MFENDQNPIDSGECAIVYVIDPPVLVSKAVPLLLSLRRHHPNALIVPYAPKESLTHIDPRIIKFHEEYQAPIQELSRVPEFSRRRYNKPYKHGNKLLAVAEMRRTDYCIFLDTDTYLAKPLDAGRLLDRDAVAAVPESVAGFARRFFEIWDAAYGIFGLTTPHERVKMLRTDREHPPYFNAGMVAFPEETPSGSRFGELWLETALTIDFDQRIDDEAKRPWLDQAALPIAIKRSGARFQILDSVFNYPVDGTAFLPKDDVVLYHYHGIERLEEAEHTREIEKILVDSGLFSSLDHYLSPLEQMRADAKVLWTEIHELSSARRDLKSRLAVLDASEHAAVKKEIQEIKRKEQNLRDKVACVVEDLYYDDAWLRKREMAKS